MGTKGASNGKKTNGAGSNGKAATSQSSQRSKQALIQKVIAAVFVGAFAILAGLMFQRWAGERAAEKALYNEFEGKDYPFELRWVKNKGMGLFATRPIKRGDRIITEKPLFRLTTEVHGPPEKVLEAQLSSLSKEDRARFMRLGNANLHTDVAVSIFQTNAVTVGKDNAGVCPTFSRINHACLGGFNVVYHWREEQEDIIVHATRDIAKGEELLTTYTDTLVPRSDRQAYLKKVYNFDCTCQACSRSAEESKKSDNRMREHRRLMDKFSSWAQGKIGGQEAIDTAKRIWNIRYNEEQPPYASTKGQLLADMAHVCAAHLADMATVEYAEGAAKWFAVEVGHDSPQFQDQVKILSLGPGMHKQFGKRAREDIKGPGGGAF